jgi:HSP20 family molecular chaperone IbpA
MEKSEKKCQIFGLAMDMYQAVMLGLLSALMVLSFISLLMMNKTHNNQDVMIAQMGSYLKVVDGKINDTLGDGNIHDWLDGRFSTLWRDIGLLHSNLLQEMQGAAGYKASRGVRDIPGSSRDMVAVEDENGAPIYNIRFTLPSYVREKDIKISVKDSILNILAIVHTEDHRIVGEDQAHMDQGSNPSTDGAPADKIVQNENFSFRFARTWMLPRDANIDAISAKLEDVKGNKALIVTIPKVKLSDEEKIISIQ